MAIDKLNAATTHPVQRTPSPAANVAKAGEPAQDAADPKLMQAIQRATAQLDSYMKSMNRSLEFRVDEASGRTVVSVRDSETGELIRQIPGEDVLRMARHMDTKSLLVRITA